MEKKKLRLGGNGATSMFRTMAWLAEVAHLGIEPAIAGEAQQVPARQREPRRPDAAPEEAAR